MPPPPLTLPSIDARPPGVALSEDNCRVVITSCSSWNARVFKARCPTSMRVSGREEGEGGQNPATRAHYSHIHSLLSTSLQVVHLHRNLDSSRTIESSRDE